MLNSQINFFHSTSPPPFLCARCPLPPPPKWIEVHCLFARAVYGVLVYMWTSTPRFRNLWRQVNAEISSKSACFIIFNHLSAGRSASRSTRAPVSVFRSLAPFFIVPFSATSAAVREAVMQSLSLCSPLLCVQVTWPVRRGGRRGVKVSSNTLLIRPNWKPDGNFTPPPFSFPSVYLCLSLVFLFFSLPSEQLLQCFLPFCKLDPTQRLSLWHLFLSCCPPSSLSRFTSLHFGDI